MRLLVLSALFLASALQTAFGEQEGDWVYSVENNQATITAYLGLGPVVVIPSEVGGFTVTKIGSNSYQSVFRPPPPSLDGTNSYITSVTIPNSVTIIGDMAFNSCAGLNAISIPNSVTSIGRDAFSGCESLTSIIIPNGVDIIRPHAFQSCRNLSTLTISSTVTSIGDYAFDNCVGLASIIIPNGVVSIGVGTFRGCSGLNNITIANSVISIGSDAFSDCTALTSLTMPDRFIAQVAQLGISGQVATDYLVNALANNDAFVNVLANNDAFVTAVANKIKETGGNYGIATQTGLSSAIEPLATQTQITTAINEGKASGIASVTASPNTWSLFTTSQIQNMAVGDLVLNRQVGGGFVLNYDIEQSTDLQTWTTYQALSLPLTGLPTDKAFVRIKPKQ